MEILNTDVDPPILVRTTITQSLNHWSLNVYIDPSDGIPFVEEDLTPSEMGHIYLHKVVSLRWVQIYMPYKVMDSSTGRLIKGLRSYKSVSPYLNGRLPEKHLKNPKSCIQHFRLSETDFQVFSRRVRSYEGVLTKDEVDLEDLSNKISNLRTTSERIINWSCGLREKACRSYTEPYYTDENKLTEVLDVFTQIRTCISEFDTEVVDVVIDIDRLSKETGRDSQKTRIDTEFQVLKSEQEKLRKLPIQRFEREAIHKSRVDLGQDNTDLIPGHVRSLQQEINELKVFYKCLSRLRVVNNGEIAIDLTGVDITFTESTVIVRGDPGALKAYMGDNESIEEESQRRVRNIIGSRNGKK